MIRFHRIPFMLAALLLLAALLAPRAHADTVLVGQTTMISGSFSGVYTFSTAGAGTLNLRLENVAWPERLAALSCNLYDHDTLLGSLATDGVLSIEIAGRGTYFSHLFAQAAGALDLGLFSLNISFQPRIDAVPLPAAGWLLLSALGLFGFKRAALPIVKFAFARPFAA
jgi:hypothetical protein